MDLTEFVKQTLTQVVAGVKQAQDSVAALGGVAAPFRKNREDEWTNVDFDVAVVVSSTSEVDGKIQVAFWGIKAGAGGGSKDNEQTTSRISFKVPLILPPGDETAYRAARYAAVKRSEDAAVNR